MKARKTKQPDKVSLSVQMLPDLKRRVEQAAGREGTSRSAWIIEAIEARLAARQAKVEKRQHAESEEFLHEEKLNDIRALRETW